MNSYRKILPAALLCALGLAACDSDNRPDGTVASVGDGAITVTDLTATLVEIPKTEQVEYLTDDGKTVLVELLIDRRLAAQAAREAGLIEQPEVAAAIAAAQRRIDVDRILESAYLKSRLSGLGEPTAAELESYYDENQPEFQQPQRIQVQRIFFKTRAEAQTARATLSANPDFEQYKRARPNAPITVDVLWLQPREKASALEASAFALAPGELSAVLETRAGYGLLRIIAEEPAQQLSLEAAMPRLVARVRRERNAQALLAIRDELRAGIAIAVNSAALASYRCTACVPVQ